MLAKSLDLSLLLPGLYLAGTLLAGAAVLAVVRRWRREEPADAPQASSQLAHYRTLYEQGQISEEDFRRLRNLLGVEIRRSVELPPRPAEAREECKDDPPQGSEGVRPA
jgi:hypothetical protein